MRPDPSQEDTMLGKLIHLRISQKLPLIIVGSTLALAISLGYASFRTASKDAVASANERLTAILEDRKAALNFYLSSIEQDMQSVSASPFTHDALSAFRDAWNVMGGDQKAALQGAYITDNPHPTGQKENLDRAGDNTSYNTTHAQYHPWFRTFLREREYYDIFLFDLKGNLIYTVFKELDYATNLDTGEYKTTDLGNAFRAARDSSTAGSLHFFDFKPYAPSHGAPASFISTPVFDTDGKKIGVLVFQMPISRINAVMKNEAGLGKTGETFIVGNDYLMRSDSRFSSSSTILNTRVDAPAIEAALTSRTYAYGRTSAYRDLDLEIYALPFEFQSAQWALVAAVGYDEVYASVNNLKNTIFVISAVLLAIIAALGYVFGRGITGLISQVVDTMDRLAHGDTNVELGASARQDEIGDMYRAVGVFRENALERKRLEAQRAESEKEEQAHRKAILMDMASQVETASDQGFATILEGAESLRSNAQEMNQSVDAVTEESQEAASRAAETRDLTQQATHVTQEVSQSIGEITEQVHQSTRLTQDAVDQMTTAQETIDHLAQSADSIGEFVSVINNMAEQTNLLALNATIEAARAGDAGNGFAVVASEVKSLAAQTAQSTEQIAESVTDIQGRTKGAVDSIKMVNSAIDKLSEVAAVISAAMEEQRAATDSFSDIINNTENAVNDVAGRIEKISAMSNETFGFAQGVSQIAGEMVRSSEQMRADIPKLIKEATVQTEHRAHERLKANAAARVKSAKVDAPASLKDISKGGVRLEGVDNITSGDDLEVTLPSGKSAKAQAVWNKDGSQGVRFTEVVLSDETVRGIARGDG